ncbi:MAG: zinc ABC transporter substrate-binding protein [Methylocystaceae bacterium]|nr:zinc ABC transporter substrate-binding protein [Methylocystaceae bacterium]
MIRKTCLTAAFLCAALSTTAFAAPKVVTSIKPVDSLARAVMKGAGTPDLLIDSVQSPHRYSLKPSDAQKIQDADVIVWVSDEMEIFLADAIKSLNPKVLSITMEDEEVPHGEDDHDHEKHNEEHAHEDHDHEKHEHEQEKHDDHDDHDDHEGHHHDKDVHYWLNPAHAIELVEKLEHELSEIDPANAKLYSKNAHALVEELHDLDHDLKHTLAAIKDKPFVVFHDAYGHFVERYELNMAGVVTLAPNKQPSVKRLNEIHHLLEEKKVKCIFSEPQFPSKTVERLIEGTPVKAGLLDPTGGTMDKGTDHYIKMMKAISNSLVTCLNS